MKKETKLRKNTITSLVLQIVNVLYGFILPRLLLVNYGSEVNGLINSIAQFLNLISLTELGVGSVVQSTLYKPLAEKSYGEVSRIISSATKFFKVVAYIFAIYVIMLMLFYPRIINSNFDNFFIISLIIILSIDSFAQYFLGIVDTQLLEADQRGYIYYSLHTILLVVTALFNIAFISLGFSIQWVKAITSLLFLLKPIIIRLYVKKHYKINRKEKYDEEPILQKWNGLYQHFATIILNNTDVVILSVFMDITSVSIYSVYNMVVYGIRQLVLATTNGISSYWGNLLATKNYKKLYEQYAWTEWFLHFVIMIIFGSTAFLLVPFINVYTQGVGDIDYAQPVFAVLLTLAQAFRCIRLPYNTMILAGGHYKQTQSSYVIAALLNIFISIALVNCFGLIGVAIGTLVAMIYQDIWMAIYNSKNFIYWPIKLVIKQYVVDFLVSVLAVIMIYGMKQIVVFDVNNYLSWVILAIEYTGVWFVSASMINIIFYKSYVNTLIRRFTKKRTNVNKKI